MFRPDLRCVLLAASLFLPEAAFAHGGHPVQRLTPPSASALPTVPFRPAPRPSPAVVQRFYYVPAPSFRSYYPGPTQHAAELRAVDACVRGQEAPYRQALETALSYAISSWRSANPWASAQQASAVVQDMLRQGDRYWMTVHAWALSACASGVQANGFGNPYRH